MGIVISGSEKTMNRTVVVQGRVQGVGFRQATRTKAATLGLHGTVRNLPDGSVEVHVSGDEEDVQRLLAWCEKGPPMAEVSHVDVVEGAMIERPGFHVIR
jgi:acylphosphatase